MKKKMISCFIVMLMAVSVALAADKPDDHKFIKNSLGMVFVLIPAGEFMMGSPPEEPQGDKKMETYHRVTISTPFYLQATEVTQGQWQAVMGYNPSFFRDCGESCPVEQVSWNEVQEFIRRLNQIEGAGKYRLPTEGEWEYAARAGTTTAFNTGPCLTTEQANYNGQFPLSRCPAGEYRARTTRVGSFLPNDWGLYDMHGNVSEWVHDWNGKYPSGQISNPTGPPSGTTRIFRGGDWSHDAWICRAASRLAGMPGGGDNYLGLRLLRVP